MAPFASPSYNPYMSTAWPLQVFFDGACPLCRREMAFWRSRDHRHRLQWVDIAAPGFSAVDYGLDNTQLQRFMHARSADGQVFTGVRAFVHIWEAIPGPMTTPLRWLFKIPGVVPIAGIFYRLFARNRYRLTGRCTPETCDVK